VERSPADERAFEDGCWSPDPIQSPMRERTLRESSGSDAASVADRVGLSRPPPEEEAAFVPVEEAAFVPVEEAAFVPVEEAAFDPAGWSSAEPAVDGDSPGRVPGRSPSGVRPGASLAVPVGESDAAPRWPPAASLREDRSRLCAGWNWNLFPPQFGQPESISFEPSSNTFPQLVHW
jgi:hypothetical protein